jgi:hypothetical protein
MVCCGLADYDRIYRRANRLAIASRESGMISAAPPGL